MKTKFFNIVFITFFMMVLCIPLVFVDLSGGAVSIKENRILATRPSMSYALQHPSDFIRQFEDWFSDNLGFRTFLLSCHALFARLENNIRYTDGQFVMLVGEEGHHYFAHTDGWMIGKYQGKPFVSDAQLQGMANGLNKAKRYLDEREIPLIVMFCVDKETIYPEYYPKSIIQGTGPTQLDIITEYALDHTDVDIFNIKERLLSAKKDYLVFDKVGDAAGILSHYNEIGAFFAYQELMKHINTYIPDIPVFTEEDIDITYADRGIYPNIPDVRLKRNLTYKQLDDGFFDGVPLDHPSQGIAYENNDPTLPILLILRDSYAGSGSFISRYLPEHFGKTILIHWINMTNLEYYIDYFKPDIVLFESAEREIASFSVSLTAYSYLPDSEKNISH